MSDPTPRALDVARDYYGCPVADARVRSLAALIVREREAARREAIEECAKVVERRANERLVVLSSTDSSYEVFQRQAELLIDAAHAIRALDLGASKEG